MKDTQDVFVQKTNNRVAEDKFYREVLEGLTKQQKSLPSKYFYDAEGDRLFQKIMECPEYYLTDCELEIFIDRTADLAATIGFNHEPFDIIELGAGDGTKTIYLLEYLANRQMDFRYLPVDISVNILTELELLVHARLPNVNIQVLAGEYLDMIAEARILSDRRKVILFLGGNIGNLTPREAIDFYREISQQLQPGDIMVTGFDLMKNPLIVRAAYDDAGGITKEFNLNLLQRINKELGADFDINLFEHYCSYNPENGACKSYLVSLVQQEVSFEDTTVGFEEGETIWMEISQKYSPDRIVALAASSGFEVVTNLKDKKGWFTDSVWRVVEQ
ncbi:L-histidine N(alpha)-methyltransferase [Runella aurantiaca]|uniref:L-histidine N(Alpha)-methyltransferase n=1 Tax=Runella aurantiaca TaxID=2282308 RepID=A0A369I504_9BACT|nr:L-histidine N(alpha)-methyltransferase [Runella aurantiaca]RDB02603.1 L-histidine N(alpha)-methyltransferase [Runella aurantiaca]